MPARRTSASRTSRAGVYRRPWPYYSRKNRPLLGTNRRRLTASDSFTLTISESAELIKKVPVAGGDTMQLLLTESGEELSFINTAGADTVTISLTGSATVQGPVDIDGGGDTVTVSISESQVLSKPVDHGPASDTVTVSVDDDGSPEVIFRAKSVADDITVSITDLGDRLTIAKRLTAEDFLITSIDEAEVLRRDKFGADSITVSIEDNGIRRSLAPETGTVTVGPFPVPDGEIMGATATWDVLTPGTTQFSMRSSVDNGATWQPVENGQQVPRILEGDGLIEAVLLQGTLTRYDSNDPSPRLYVAQIDYDVAKHTVEMMPQGVFGLAETVISDGKDGAELTLTAYDSSRAISLNPWEQVFVIPAGTPWGQAIQQAISNRRPGTVFNFVSTTEVCPQLVFGAQTRNDPWQDFVDCAQVNGCELFFDENDVCTMQPEPDPQVGDPVWIFTDEANPVITGVSRSMSDEDTRNYIVITGESSGNETPARGIAVDNDPSSPVYVKGSLGQRTWRESSSLITTDSQATTMAQAVLLRRRGATEVVEIDVVPMQALQASDIVGLKRDAIGLDDNYMVDGLVRPVGGGADGAMHLTTRRQRLAGDRPIGGGVGGIGGNDGGTGGGGGGGTPRTYGSPGEALKIGANGNLNHFKLQTAFSGGSDIVEVSQAEIGSGYEHVGEFCMNSARNGVQFAVNLDAPTTSGSSNPRSELREVQTNGTTLASWATSGLNYVLAVIKITKVPDAENSICVMQVHDSSDDVMQILTRNIGGQIKLCYRLNGDDDDAWVLDGSYAVGDEFVVALSIEDGVGKIYYASGSDPGLISGTPTVTCGSGGIPAISTSGGCYFKVGAYPQRTADESSSDYASMEVRKLGLYHPGYPAPVYDSDTVDSGNTADFTVAYGACINASGSGAFTHIHDLRPDYFIHLGDVWYKDGATPNWNADWDAKFSESRYAAMLADLPNPQIVLWSDHDFGYANNSTGSDNSSRTNAANAAYREQFPDVELPELGIYRDWSVGRVKFIALDCLTFKSPLSASDNSSKTMLGTTQKNWLRNLLSSDEFPLIIVFGDGQMPGPKEAGQDEWRGYDTERRQIQQYVDASPATVIYCNGDTHSLAVGHDQFGFARCWQSAPLHNDTKVKAGGDGYSFTYPTNANEGTLKELYAVMTFTDNGSEITATWRGYEGSAMVGSDYITV